MGLTENGKRKNAKTALSSRTEEKTPSPLPLQGESKYLVNENSAAG